MPADRIPIEKSPGFYTRGGRVEFRFTDNRGKRRWRSARNVTEAKRLKAELQTDVARGEHRRNSRMTVAAYARSWISTYEGRTSKGIREHSKANLERRLADTIEFFGEMRMAEVEPQDVKSFAAWVAKRPRRGARFKADLRPLAANTVRLTLVPMKAMFATAYEEGVIRANPAAGVKTTTRRDDVDAERKAKALTDEQLVAILNAIANKELEDGRWLLFFRVLVSLGLRFSEICELRWLDIDFGKRIVRIRRVAYGDKVGPPKSKYGRRDLRLAPELATALWNARKLRGGRADGELVFTDSEGGRVNASNLMSRVLKPAAVDAGIGERIKRKDREPLVKSWVGFHTFRHTCATLLFVREKWNPKQVQTWLGHHSAAFTLDTYVHLLPAELPEPPMLGGNAFGTESGTTGTQEDAKTSPVVRVISGG